MNMDDAAQKLADALHDPTEGMRRMARIGVTFTRWQRWRIRFWLFFGKARRVQRIILRSFDEHH